jgi:hypothetical protein
VDKPLPSSNYEENENPSSKDAMSALELKILETINASPDQEWTSRSTVEALKSVSYRLPEKDEAAMNAVGYALIALKDAKKIVRIHEGKGRNPHRYVSTQLKQEE